MACYQLQKLIRIFIPIDFEVKEVIEDKDGVQGDGNKEDEVEFIIIVQTSSHWTNLGSILPS